MKKNKILIMASVMLLFLLEGCQKEMIVPFTKTSESEEIDPIESIQEDTLKTITMQIEDSIFTIKLYENEATKQLLETMPLDIQMDDLHENEKYVYTNTLYSTQPELIQTIQTGDFMLYGNQCIVLFYQDFSTSYSYTKLGYVENPDQLKEILGQGSVEIHFRVDERKNK